MGNAKKSIFSALKESLVKTGCCGPTCAAPVKQGANKNVETSKTDKNKK